METVDSATSDGSNCKLNDGVSLVKVNDFGICTVTAVEAAPKETGGLVVAESIAVAVASFVVTVLVAELVAVVVLVSPVN